MAKCLKYGCKSPIIVDHIKTKAVNWNNIVQDTTVQVSIKT